MVQLRNYTEEAVKMYVEKEFPKVDCCHCEGCMLDVMAIMLNNMSSQFVVTDQGELYAQMRGFDPQYRADLLSHMELAIKAVKNRPKHCEKNPEKRDG